MGGAPHPVRWWLAGADTTALLAELERVAGSHDGHSNSGHSNGNGATGPSSSVMAGSGPVRLGIVDPDERKLRLARRLVAKGEPWRGRSDIWFTSTGFSGTAGQVAFLFPGVEPTFEAAAVDLPGLAHRFGLEPPAVEDDTVAHRSASIYRLGIFLDQVLRALGVEPDVIGGHSIGEWSGTVAAGIVPRDRAGELVDTTDLDGIRFPDLDFAALAAGTAAVAPVVEQLEGVDISHDNSPRQSVLCGPPALVDEALDRLRAASVLGYKLPFQSGFHTPAVAPLVDHLRPGAQSLPFGPAAVPMWSATTVAPYPTDHDDILELHLRHLTETVRFRPLVERLYHDAGARIFVQLGLGSLTGFVDQTLDGLDHITVPLLSTKRSALAQVHRALTALWVEGVDVRPNALDASGGAHVSPGQTRPQSSNAAGTILATANLLSVAAHAGRDVIEALASRLPTSAPATTGSPLATPPAATTPTSPPEVWPREPLSLSQHLSLESRPETLDHRLFDQPPDWPDPSDGFPIVAMTTQIQLLQDIATGFAPDRQVVEVSGIRNTRWLDLSDPQDVEIRVTPQADDVLGMMLGRHCRANLRLGHYPASPPLELAPLTNPGTPEHTAEQMFEQRVMFHGPRYHGVTTLGPIGDNGMAGELHHLETPGSLLDNLGKLIAYWVMDHRGWGEAALPISVDKIQFFGPEPPPGTAVHCDIRIVDLQRDAVTADGVLLLPDGTTLCRVDRWTSIVFHRDELMEPVSYDTPRHQATEPQPGGWSVVQERWPTGPGRELTARRYMARAEREVFERLNLLQQRRHLIDLVAAKDVVRHWLREHHRIPSYPVEISLVAEGDDRYRAVSPLIPDGHDLRITLSSIDWLAVAVVGDGAYRDIEVREIPQGADAEGVGAELAEAVAARNPDRPVEHIAPVTNLLPSRLEVVSPPPFAVAWTEESRT